MKYIIIGGIFLLLITDIVSTNIMLSRSHEREQEIMMEWEDTIKTLNKTIDSYQKFQNFCKPYLLKEKQ